MLTAKQFLNKIKYSRKFNKSEITIYYFDRIKNTLIPIAYKNLKIKDDYIIIQEKQIPLHRIKEIRQKGIIIWKR